MILITRRRREMGIKPKKHTTNNTIAYHLLTNAQLVPKQWLAAPNQLPPVYILRMIFHGMEYPLN